jgi:ATP synthase protein I
MDPGPVKPKRRRSDRFLRFTGMAMQMGLIIAAGVWGGIRLDQIFANNSHIWTLSLSLLSVGLAMFLVIRDLTRLV